MDKNKLKELRGKLGERGEQLGKILEEAGPDRDMSKVESIEGDSQAKVEKIRALNDEIDDLKAQAEPLEAEYAELERADERARVGAERGHPLPERGKEEKSGEGDLPSLGEFVLERDLAGENRNRAVLYDVEPQATLFKTGEGWEPEVTRTGRVVDKETRPIQVIDVIPAGTTSQTAVKFLKEVTFTNNAAEKAEAAEYPEAALKLEDAESAVRKIAVWLPVTDEQLEDVPQAQGYVNRRLPFMLRQRLDGQIVGGNGVAPNLEGLEEAAGKEQAKGEDSAADAVFKAATVCEVEGRAMPGPVLMHPNDWQEIRLERTNDGIYIWGNPNDSGVERIFGHRVVKTDALEEGTAIIGDFAAYSELAFKRGIELKMTDSHAEHFIEGKQAVRADLRAALVVYRPNAFCKVTGI